METLIIHFNDYETKFDQTVNQIVDFLDLDMVVNEKDIPSFQHGKSYRDYYTAEQIIAITKLIRYLAHPETLGLIKAYLI